MQLHSTDYPSAEAPDDVFPSISVIPESDYLVTEESSQSVIEPTQFYTCFIDYMELCAATDTVTAYFDEHHAWFCRCAHPMKATSIGENSYALIIGRFGAFGYEVEPQIGLDLLPQADGIYRIETVPVPGYAPLGYDVDFRAAMELLEQPSDEPESQEAGCASQTETITRVQWKLDLTVTIQFPRFIHTLPKSLIQTTGDRLLGQIVRQVSNRLTRKVLDDFHKTHGLPMPKRNRRWFFMQPESNLNSSHSLEP